MAGKKYSTREKFMKKNSFWKIGLALIGIFTILLCTCEEDNGGGGNPPVNYDIVGYYTFSQDLPSGGEQVYTWVFKEDNNTYEITRSIGDTKNTGKWSVSGNDITLTDTSPQYAGLGLEIKETFTITSNGNQVTLTLKGDSQASAVLVQFNLAATSITLTKQITYNVIFNANGGEPVPKKQMLRSGEKASNPDSVSKTGYKFEGWFKEEDFINQWDFDTDTVTSNIILYAKWKQLTPFLAKLISANRHTVAIRTDGSLWAWGSNNYGQLGDGTETNKNTPTRIGTDTNWKSVSTGSEHTIALKTDGSLWAWGSNVFAQLGDGTGGGGFDDNSGNKNIQTKIGTDTNWASVSAGGYHTVAIKTDGSLWAWGNGDSGRLGDGTETNKNTPTQIGTDKNWKSVSAGWGHTVAIKTDGSLWAWGRNYYAQLGDGTGGGGWEDKSGDKNIPTRIGIDTNWKSVSAGPDQTIALKTDGSLWAWGVGSMGGPKKTTPTRIGTDTNLATVSAISSVTTVIKTDSSLWICTYYDSTQIFIDE